MTDSKQIAASDSVSARGLDRELYMAYAERAGGVNFRGEPLPAWEALPAYVQDNWTAVARCAIRRLVALS
jgi:hypothetical protein